MSHPSAHKSGNPEEFLKLSQIAPQLNKALLQSHASSSKAKSEVAGWHGLDDIETLKGLGGSYLWSENPVNVTRINFRFDPQHIGYDGNYEIISGLSTLEQGSFHSIPNNPAIGWAGITLSPGNGSTPRTFIVMGMVTDSDWKIEILMLEKLGTNGPMLPLLSAVRLP